MFNQSPHDCMIQKSFKIQKAHFQESILGRFPFKALKITDEENKYPEDEHLSTMWNDIVEPQGNFLPILLSTAHPEMIMEHFAIPSIDYPGYWLLSGTSGLFFESICCNDGSNSREIYFYGLTDDEVRVLHRRTELNKKFIQREMIFNYVMDRGAVIKRNGDIIPPADEEVIIVDSNDNDDEEPQAKKPKSSFPHPGQSWPYNSDDEDSDHDINVV